MVVENVLRKLCFIYGHVVFLSYRVRQSVLERSEVPEDLRLLEPARRGIRILLGCCKVSSKPSPKYPPSPNHVTIV